MVATQMRVLTVSGLDGGRLIWLGLDCAAAKAALDLEKLEVEPDVWRQVRIIETGAIEELNRG